MADDELLIALTFTAAAHGEIRIEVETASAAAQSTAASLDEAEARAAAIRRTLGIDSPEARSLSSVRPSPEPSTPASWNEVLHRASIVVGDQPEGYGGLVEKEARDQIDRRFTDGWTMSLRLDRYDLVAAVAAGVTAALMDYLLVAVPSESGLTNALRSLGTRDDNWLAGLAKVPYDRVADVPISGFAPMTHRVQTFGHDPLLGWVYGTMDIIRGTLSGVSRQGIPTVLDMAGGGADGLVVALAVQAMHLVSDVVTPAGLPLPGWTALLAVDQQIPGSEHTVAQLARYMYVRGYDTWHLPAMAMPLFGVEAVLRGYLGLRQALDDEYHADLDIERARVGSNAVADLPRYETMALIARGIVAAGNAGKFALSGANPLTLNYAVWLAFGKTLLGRLSRTRPASAMIATAHTNRILLDAGWDALDDAALPTIPSDPGARHPSSPPQ